MIQKTEAWDVLKEYRLQWPKTNGGAEELSEKYEIYYRMTAYCPPSDYKKAKINWIIERDYNSSYDKEMIKPWYEVSLQYETGNSDPWKKYIYCSIWNDRFGTNNIVLIPKTLPKKP